MIDHLFDQKQPLASWRGGVESGHHTHLHRFITGLHAVWKYSEPRRDSTQPRSAAQELGEMIDALAMASPGRTAADALAYILLKSSTVVDAEKLRPPSAASASPPPSVERMRRRRRRRREGNEQRS